jgi:CxxC motif-containing protein (DUF1111 family)
MKPYLHDGRAKTLTDAIGMHVNEALASRDSFFALSPTEQRAVQKFLTR